MSGELWAALVAGAIGGFFCGALVLTLVFRAVRADLEDDIAALVKQRDRWRDSYWRVVGPSSW